MWGMDHTPSLPNSTRLAFVGGGNMASAILGGLIRRGLPAGRVVVVEPHAPQRERLQAEWGVQTLAEASPALGEAEVVVWAVKPQTFREAAAACAPHTGQALHLSVAAGIRTDSIAHWLRSEQVVRAMPNTPALVGLGMTGLFARPGVDAAACQLVEAIVATTGQWLWLRREADLDAVTALSGSGPAYVFYFIEAMRQAGSEMGLSPEDATRLAVATFQGAAQLAASASEPPEVLRERVTSKGGTTYAALTSMEADGMKAAFVRALHAARQRARELGDEFGR